jgi:N-acetylneuraminic acid mutarotase
MNDMWEYSPNTYTWLWLKGSKFGNQMGIYGTTGVEDSQNTPGGRFNYSNWTYNNKLYLHAGEGQVSDPFGDLWMYNPTTNNWAFLKGFQHAGPFGTIYGTKGVEAAPNQPGRRTSCASWTYNNKLYLYGGVGSDVNSNSGYLSDIWEYNPATNNWMWSNGSNLVGQPLNFIFLGNGIADPGNRFNQTTWLHENFVYLFGGNSNLGLLNDTWKYNLSTKEWSPLNININQNQVGNYGTLGVPATTNTPGGRSNAASWIFNKKIYLMGGYGFGNSGPAGYLNDLWEYKPTTNMWTWLKGSFSIEQGGNYGTINIYNTNNIPGAKAGSSNFIFNNKLYLFGGYGYGSGVGAGYLNDLWEYTPSCTETYSVASGNWNTTSTWFCNKVPTATEAVSIYGHTIDLTGNGYAKSVIYNPTGTLRIGVGGNLILNP